jgi:Leucine-rich repeat (LRR) protein
MWISNKIFLILMTLINFTSFSQDSEYVSVKNFSGAIDSLFKINPDIKEVYISFEDTQTPLCEEIYKFSKLEVLICDGAVNHLPNGISKLKELKILSLKYCLIEKLPNDIIFLNKLEELDVMHSSLVEVPKNIGELKQLKKLLLGGTNLSFLPEGIKELSNLEEIMFCVRFLKEMPLFILEMNWLNIVYTGICMGKTTQDEYKTKEEISEFKVKLKSKLSNTQVY